MANYAIMRIEKRKLPSVGRINKHHERQKEEYKSNPDIDRGRTGLNYHIVQPPGPYREAALARIEQAGHGGARTAWCFRTALWAALLTG